MRNCCHCSSIFNWAKEWEKKNLSALTFDYQQNVPASGIRHSIVGDAPEISYVLSACIPDVQVGSAVRKSRLRALAHFVVVPFPAHMLLGQWFALDAAGQRHVLTWAHNRVL